MRNVFLILLMLTAGAWSEPEVKPRVEAVLPAALELYRWLHANPELSGQEKNTAARLASELQALGMEVHTGVGGHGLVALLRSGRPGPLVLYRADMDALPVTEATGLPYASRNQGVMHACGHDIHMATAVGTMAVLKSLAGSWGGTVVLVAQPAEEAGAGAVRMLEDPRFGTLLEPLGKPVLCLALHDTTEVPAGQVQLLSGYVSANVDSLDIVIHGRGGHGARPDRAIDPIVIGSEIVLALQTIVSRRLEPGEPAVVTVGRFEGGTKHNIIPSQATMMLTVRSYGDESRQRILEEIRRVVINVARAHAAPQDPDIVVLDDFTPSVYNDPDWTERLQGVFTQAVGADNVRPFKPSTGGEDFCEFSRRLGCPGVMFELGAVDPQTFAGGGPVPGLHSDLFAPAPEPTLRTGILLATLGLLAGLAGP